MGYMRHHAIVVTSWKEDAIFEAHAVAVDVFVHMGVITAVTPAVINGYRSFMIAPDGSKEGWEDSDYYDLKRKEFKEYLEGTKYDDGSGCVDWVEVQFGDDNRQTLVVDDSDKSRRESAKQ